MKKYFYCLAVVFATVPFISYAQTTYEDVVSLKNGSIIHGVILEQTPNQSLKIQTSDKNLFVFKMDEVEKMTREPIIMEPSGMKRSGFTNISEVNTGLEMKDLGGQLSIGVQTISGYQITPHYNVGVGVGVDKYKDLTFVPLFVDVRINYLETSFTPFISAAGGYSVLWSGGRDGGMFFNPSFGVKYFISQHAAINFSIGFRYQEYYKTYYTPPSPSYHSYSYDTRKEILNVLNCKIGISI